MFLIHTCKKNISIKRKYTKDYDENILKASHIPLVCNNGTLTNLILKSLV